MVYKGSPWKSRHIRTCALLFGLIYSTS
jgi:hypothetical protein